MNDEILKLNETTEDTLVFIREFDTTIDHLFEVLTRSEHIAKWQIPDNMEVNHVTADLVVGGEYRISMHSPDRDFDFELFGEYLEIDPPNRIVFTQNVPGLEPMSKISITLTQDSDRTQMVFQQSEIASKQMRDNGLKGWAPVFVQLEKYIQKL